MDNHEINEAFNEVPKGGARPMKVFIDDEGYEWLCDKNIDPNGSFEGQGCWRTDQIVFDRSF
ncbi:MAG: hypothetical protein ABIJ45_02470 [Candidatus Zixiibacteriota bacterium]